jgi:hypothetical protein
VPKKPVNQGSHSEIYVPTQDKQGEKPTTRRETEKFL